MSDQQGEMKTETRKVLMSAALSRDYAVVKDLGWWPVYTALSSWWSRRFSVEDLVAFADLLGNENPQSVAAAVKEMAGAQYPPSPAELYRQVQTDRAQAAAAREQRRPRKGRPDLEVGALIRVRLLLDRGEHVCQCRPRPSDCLVDAVGVLRCPACDGIDAGQADEADLHAATS